MLPTIEYQGALYSGFLTEEDAVAAGIPQGIVEAATTAAVRAAMICTPRQARLALEAAGLLGAVDAWVASASETIRIEWEYAIEIRRDYPPLVQAGAALGLSDAQLDGLFAAARAL